MPLATISRPTLLILTGTCGVGKSTTARAWAEQRRGAHISGDEVRNWMRDKATRRANDYQHQACTEIIATAAEQFIALGLDVALDYVWMPQMLRSLTTRFESLATLKMAWLRCEPSENRRRDAERPASVVMGQRVDDLQCELDAFKDWPDELERIDSTGLTVEQVLARLA